MDYPEQGSEMKAIITYKGQEIFVDDEDFAKFGSRTWHVDSEGYAGTNGWIGRKKERLHRAICGLTKGDGMTVDHINGNRLDNRRQNLRVCTNAENVRNAGKKARNTSGYKGVSRTNIGKWVAHIRVNNKSINIGTFTTPEDAYVAYCNAARELHGEFANFGA